MKTVLSVAPLGFPWQTLDPFLFCVHHNDAYPPGDADMAVAPELLAGRAIGQDFSAQDGWSMYHGTSVPGFPSHPHRGFETVTIVRQGRIDHADSLGATARFGGGDVQWLTAGKGIVHSEMFPLLHTEAPNPTELFQIWVNLPAKSKMAEPHFTMFWHENIPRICATDASGRSTEVVCIAGRLGATRSLPPPPDSWASAPDSDLGIFTIRMEPGARWTLPAAHSAQTQRVLYFFKGDSLRVAGEPVPGASVMVVAADQACTLENGDTPSELLVLQARPIGEPVAQYGPFVMNTQAEIHQAFADYRRTEFGGWPWDSPGPVHPRAQGRFAQQGKAAPDLPE
ncbi:MAG: pirin family protein [Rhodoferax sp.]|nr:pirin family protein [Rhodoferax sp.]